VNMSDSARVQPVRAHSGAGEPPALHMLPSRLLQKFWNDFELGDTSGAARPHMERGQLARPASGSELCALRCAKAHPQLFEQTMSLCPRR
jgi:hypothetical protein